MNDSFHIENVELIPSPSLVFFDELIDQNVTEMIRIAERPDRLRPHCKTHKTRQIIEKLLERGIKKHKCATIAEAELLAETGVKDIFLAYNIVGPNITRVLEFKQKYPDVAFAVTADHPVAVRELSNAASVTDVEIDVVMDLDTGLCRTGISPGDQAVELYEIISSSPGIRPGGLHWYDGQHRQPDLFERTTAVEIGLSSLIRLRDRLMVNGFSVPRTVVGGTGSFPIHASHSEMDLELSPGTVVLHDAGYKNIYPDLNFNPAAAVLTRVVSRPTSRRVTFDLGSKSIAADSPVGTRSSFPGLPEGKEIMQNEEHLVLEFPNEVDLKPGDYQLAIPWHVCPTNSLYPEANIVRDGKIVDQWKIIARDRKLTI